MIDFFSVLAPVQTAFGQLRKMLNCFIVYSTACGKITLRLLIASFSLQAITSTYLDLELSTHASAQKNGVLKNPDF